MGYNNKMGMSVFIQSSKVHICICVATQKTLYNNISMPQFKIWHVTGLSLISRSEPEILTLGVLM